MIEDFKQYLEFAYRGMIASKQTLEETSGQVVPFPEQLHERLKDALTAKKITGFYAHQKQAYDSILQGQDTLLVSKTASGKTFSFFLPILQDYLNSSSNPFTVLFLYPTKALSRDQEGVLNSLLESSRANTRIGTYDGDTSRELRYQIQLNMDFIITNPDMLHSGILPNHNRKWRSFLSRLKYIVIDEVHTYRGTFGSHVSNVLRRLIRICEHHGSNPLFICSSATMGNPLEHVEKLIAKKVTLIDNDSSPRSHKDIYFLNPSLYLSKEGVYLRKSPQSLIIPLIQEATRRRIRTICFARSRQLVERTYKSCVDGFLALSSLIRPYRGGLLPLERRKLEHDLFLGKINTVISTNALELGIDIGDLDLCILSGHPGTMASFWQQIGRVGRKGRKCIIILVGRENPLDQFFIQHPEFLWSAPIEKAFVSPENSYVLLEHLPCAANEVPLRTHEAMWPFLGYKIALDVLTEKKQLTPFRENFYYSGSTYPALGVNLRGMTDYNIEIYCDGVVIGQIDPIGARDTLYKDAIYIHLGKKYMSLELDLKKKLAQVTPVLLDYYTESTWNIRVEMVDKDESRFIHDNELVTGLIYVNRTPKLFKKIKDKTHENIGYGPITLDPFEFKTEGMSFIYGEKWKNVLNAIDYRYAQSALLGLGYIIHKLAPALCMADFGDIEHDVALQDHQQTSPSALFIYDHCIGGVGYSKNIFDSFEELLKMCLQLVNDCQCKLGCPSCIPPVLPKTHDSDLEELFVISNASKACTISLLEYVLFNQINIPKVIFQTQKDHTQALKENSLANSLSENDEQEEKLRKQLTRSYQILDEKKSRIY